MDGDFLAVEREEELVLLLGSNMGNKSQNLFLAREALERDLGPMSKYSAIYETAPWGNVDQDVFLNQAIVIPCRVKPMIALEVILNIEQELGRTRKEKWGPRLIDIDIIFYGQLMFQSDFLEIPHPYMHDRLFVLGPLNEIIPQFIHPWFHKKVSELYEQLSNGNLPGYE